MIGGQVLGGANGAAGEIGYNLRSMTDVDVPLAARVLLEDMISGQGLDRRAARHITHGQQIQAGEVLQASQQHAELDRLVTDFVTELAFHVVNLAICVNPARIAVAAAWSGPGIASGRACTMR